MTTSHWLTPRLASKLVKVSKLRLFWGIKLAKFYCNASSWIRRLFVSCVSIDKTGDRTAGPVTTSQLHISSTSLTRLVLVSLGCDLEFASAEALG